METKKRSIAKALTYRLTGTIITMVVALLITKDLSSAAAIGLADSGIKIFVYYLHERVWIMIPYGKIKPPDYQI